MTGILSKPRMLVPSELPKLDRLMQESAPADYEPFPDQEPGEKPTLYRVLVQVKAPVTKTKGGILTADETQEHDQYRETVGKIVALGPLAFKDRATGNPWPGEHPKVGDYVRMPMAGARNWKMYGILFVVFDDLEIQTVLTYEP